MNCVFQKDYAVFFAFIKSPFYKWGATALPEKTVRQFFSEFPGNWGAKAANE